MQVELDRADLRILEVLQHHGDLSAADIADRVDLTPSTCWRRISRLEELGVIRTRVALLDREKLGLNVTVFSRVKLATHGRDELGSFGEIVRQHSEVLECYTPVSYTHLDVYKRQHCHIVFPQTAAAPPTISASSLVIAAWRALL